MVQRVAWLVKQTLVGKQLLALRRMRRLPTLVRACRPPRVAAARHGRSRAGAPVARGAARGVFLTSVGPGERAVLDETIASIRRYEPDAPIVVVPDGAHDLDAQRFADDPGVDVVWPRYPSGGPPRQSPQLSRGYRHVLERYDPEVVCKIDTDALLTGSGFFDRAAERFAAEPELGILGSTVVRADGTPDDATYPLAMTRHERRWSRVVRRLHDRALAHGWTGHQVQGGVYLMSRRGLRALGDTGHLAIQPPWWTLISEDHWYSLGIQAAGLRLGSYGGPGGPIASGQGFLPIPKERVLEPEVQAIHSVRRGIDGEDEAELRAFFRAARVA